MKKRKDYRIKEQKHGNGMVLFIVQKYELKLNLSTCNNEYTWVDKKECFTKKEALNFVEDHTYKENVIWQGND